MNSTLWHITYSTGTQAPRLRGGACVPVVAVNVIEQSQTMQKDFIDHVWRGSSR